MRRSVALAWGSIGVGAIVLMLVVAITLARVEVPPTEGGVEPPTCSSALVEAMSGDGVCRSEAGTQLLGGVMLGVPGVLAVAWGWRDRQRTRSLATRAAPSGSPALDRPTTRESLLRLRRRGALVGAVGLVGLTVFVWMVQIRSRDVEALARDGERADGTVVAISGVLTLDDWIEVEFAHESSPLTVRVSLNDSSPDYDVGDRGTVVYDALDPERATVAGEENDPPVWVWTMVTCLVGGAAALVSGVVWLDRARRWRQILDTVSWRTGRVRLARVPRGRAQVWMAREHPPFRPAGDARVVVGARSRSLRVLPAWRDDVDADAPAVVLHGRRDDGDESAAPADDWSERTVQALIAGADESRDLIVARADGSVVGAAVRSRSTYRQRRWNHRMPP